jgi:sodium-dependent dicarboxylate transporter 2/3/5
MFVPILISVCLKSGILPQNVVIPVVVAVSMAFMLPIATPPNAIVYGTGYIKLKDMIKAGLILDIIFAIYITIFFFAFSHILKI